MLFIETLLPELNQRQIMKIILALGLCWAPMAFATPMYLPVADGSVYSSGAVITSSPIFTGAGDLEGDLQFASFYSAGYGSIELEMNPYELPLFGNTVSVYGYDNAAGDLTGSDYGVNDFISAPALILPSCQPGQRTGGVF